MEREGSTSISELKMSVEQSDLVYQFSGFTQPLEMPGAWVSFGYMHRGKRMQPVQFLYIERPKWLCFGARDEEFVEPLVHTPDDIVRTRFEAILNPANHLQGGKRLAQGLVQEATEDAGIEPFVYFHRAMDCGALEIHSEDGAALKLSEDVRYFYIFDWDKLLNDGEVVGGEIRTAAAE